MLVDSHCHLDFPDFEGERDDVVRRAREAGVGWIVTIGTRISAFDQVLAIAKAYENVFCTVGIHPHDVAKEVEARADRLVALTGQPKVVGIGETGLDFYYDNSPREVQETSFRTHIRAAREAGLPIVVHTRDADAETVRILSEEMGEGPFAGVIHCFTASRWLAERALDLGFYISFSGIATFRKSDDIRATAVAVPADRILVETDAPYLAPEPVRGRRNEPANVAHTARFLARLRGVEEDAFVRATTENFFRLFTKAGPRESRAITDADPCG
jgi:TatD DNase family protein